MKMHDVPSFICSCYHGNRRSNGGRWPSPQERHFIIDLNLGVYMRQELFMMCFCFVHTLNLSVLLPRAGRRGDRLSKIKSKACTAENLRHSQFECDRNQLLFVSPDEERPRIIIF